MNDFIATAGFQYDQAEYKKFQKIFWHITQKKKYVKFQLITLALLIIPGIYFGITYWIFIKSTVRKTMKLMFKGHEDGVFQNFSFADTGFNIKTEFYNEDFNYGDFKFIVNFKGYLAMYHKNDMSGYCIPLQSIVGFDKLHQELLKLPNYIEVNK